MRISVIVPCRNEVQHIRVLLQTILAQELEPGWQVELLIADGMSDDGTRDVLEEFSRSTPAVRVIDNPGRIVSTGLNAAIRASSGEVIIRMDVHSRYATDYIRQCVTVLRETGADNVGGPWICEARGSLGQAISAASGSHFCSGGGKAHDASYEGEVDTVFLGCWPREVFSRIGMFDDALVRNQDDEFNFRLRRAGGRVWQAPRIRVRHVPRKSLGRLFRQYLQYGYWKPAVIRKHGAVASWRHLVPGIFVSSLVAFPALIALAAVFGKAQAAWTLTALLGVELAAYALALGAETARLAGALPWRPVLLFPVVVAAHHVAYGAGFLLGLVAGPGRSSQTGTPEFLTALTR